MSDARQLRRGAAELSAPFPPLLAEAEQLAATVMFGEHGRRRAGLGDEFWQYRPAAEGDEARLIDWRRSAKSDVHFIRQKEWQAAQSVLLWPDLSESMAFSSHKNLPTKDHRVRLVALALATLLVRGGERVGLADSETPPATGETQLLRLAEALASGREALEYGAPELRGLRPNVRAVLVSDFMGDIAKVETALQKASDRGVRGALLQVLDPAEEAFPYDGRTIFESMGGQLQHETLKAGDLRRRYLDRLAARKDELTRLARASGWQYQCHHTDSSAQIALMWLYRALEQR
ncbi:DUF58 domain-containing protein [Cochlodiniinecator piscidefendens]|uniref:DUF58 domain-containing protein n=1 Tax=Cochlodiniinecator piscidefendens TaxID=2715756 RepID=UPI0014076E52|nr:DUF58 domain-containing protein [Cochlodiniinecator piscidefendens]